MNLKLISIISFYFFGISYGKAQALESSENEQGNPWPFQVGMNAGISFAFGNFSEDNPKIESSAFAKKRGSVFQLVELVYTIRPQLKAKAYYMKSRHNVAEDELATNLTNETFSYEVTASSSYETNALVFGFGFSMPGNTSSFDLYFLAAIGSTFIPSFDIIETERISGSTTDLEIDSQSKGSFGVGLNPNISIHLNSRLDFTTQLAFLVFDKQFEPLRSNPGIVGSNSSYGYEAFNLNFGFSYRL